MASGRVAGAPVAREDLESRSDDSDVGARGRRIATCLFSAGMDVQFALMVAGDGPAGLQLRHAAALRFRAYLL